MRVLMILDNLSRDSGVSSIVMNLLRNIDKNNVKIDFLIFKEGNDSYIDEAKSIGSKVYILPNPLSISTVITGIKSLKSFFKKHSKDYDIVHLHSPTLNDFTLKYAKKYNIKNRVIHSHSTMTSSNIVKKIINSFLMKKSTKYANHFFACSSEAASFLYGDEFCKQNKITLIKNAIEVSNFIFDYNGAQDIKHKYNINDELVLIHVSNFSKIKNAEFIIPILNKLKDQNIKVKCIFVGEGPTKNSIERKVNEFNLENLCIFTGRSKEVEKLLSCADIFLLPSFKEGLPVTVVEAQANGLSCIVTDTVTREADAGNVTYLPLEVNKWVDAIISFIQVGSSERVRRNKLISNGLFNIVNEAKRVEEIYMSMEYIK